MVNGAISSRPGRSGWPALAGAAFTAGYAFVVARTYLEDLAGLEPR